MLLLPAVLMGQQPRNASSRELVRVDRPETQKFAPGELLVRFRPTVKSAAKRRVHTMVGALSQKPLRAVPGLELVRLPERITVEEAIRAYEADANVVYAEPNYVVKTLGEPTDPLFGQQWSLHNTGQNGGKPGADIGALAAWDLVTGDTSVVVGVLDTGLDYTHPDLQGNVFRNTADCDTNGIDDDANGYIDDCYGIDVSDFFHDSDPMDDNGHGTHVGGTIGATGNNALGIAGVNWRIQVFPCKFLNSAGFGTLAGAIECLAYLKEFKDRGVNIVATNNSWGGFESSQALVDAIAAQRQSGILFVAAAGNDFRDTDKVPTYPAGVQHSNVISVAASTRLDERAFFSNIGKRSVHLSAPGQDILSTLPGGYGEASGTSMAAPHVAGVAALLRAYNPALSWSDIRSLILAGGEVVPELSETATGRRLDAHGAITCTNTALVTRLRPVENVVSTSVGGAVVFSFQNTNCATPLNELEVTIQPSGTNVTLRDDGLSPDAAPDDGVFSGQWIPQSTGTYEATLPDGSNAAVLVLTPYVAVQELPSYRLITGTSLDLGDESVSHIAAPFPIRFGEGSFQDLYVSSNGTISFTHWFGEFFNRPLPLAKFPPFIFEGWDRTTTTLLSPFWDDLYPVPGTAQNVFWEVTGSAPDRELVVEWRNVRIFDCRTNPDATVRFQVVFRENSSHVLYQYDDIISDCRPHDRGGSASVGLQISPESGVEWGFHSAIIVDGSAIRFQLVTEPLPVNPLPVLNAILPNNAAVGSGDLVITLQGTGFVAGSRVRWNSFGLIGLLGTTYVSEDTLTAFVPASLLSMRETVQITVQNPEPGGGISNARPFGVGHVPPWITSVSPSSAVAGGPTFTLTVNGEGLENTRFLLWTAGGFTTSLDPKQASPSQAQFDISAGLIATARTVQLAISTPIGGVSNTVDFVVSAASGSQRFFQLEVTPPAGFRHDWGARRPMRFLGWSFAQHGGQAYIQQFSRARRGLSAAPPEFIGGTPGESLPPGTPLPGISLRPALPGGFLPTSVAAGDFNRDGKQDWVVANGGDSNLWLYLGRGDGSSELPRIIPLNGFSPLAVVAVDLRKNGVLDLVVAEIDSGTVGVLLGNGDGTFELEIRYYLPGAPSTLVAGDFDGDGHVDVVAGMIGSMASGPLAFLGGDGTGRLKRPVTTPSQKPVSAALVGSMISGDFDNDGLPDLAVIDFGFDGGTFAYLNLGNGVFKSSNWLSDDFFASELSIDAGDLNNDGCTDLVNLNVLSVTQAFMSNCDGTFTLRDELHTSHGDLSYGMKLVDVNNDDKLDLVSSGIYASVNTSGLGQNSGTLLTVMFGKGDGGFERPRVFRGDASAFSLAAVDLNADGLPEIITANQDNDSVVIFRNDGAGGFGEPEGLYVGRIIDGGFGAVNTPLSAPYALDLDGDGDLDLAYLEAGAFGGDPVDISTLLNDGLGRFGSLRRSPVLFPPYFALDGLFGDFRGTGQQDYLFLSADVANGANAYNFVPNTGGGSFGTAVRTPAPEAKEILAKGDFDGDGKLDFVTSIAFAGANQVRFFRGNGDGTFHPNVLAGSIPGGTFAERIAVADFNKDGKLDLLVGFSEHPFPLFQLMGNGNGTFGAPRQVNTVGREHHVADVNGDGRSDLIVRSANPFGTFARTSFEVFLAQPDGTLALAHTYQPYPGDAAFMNFGRAGRRPIDSAMFGDYDGDGRLDIASVQRIMAFPFAPAFAQFMKGQADGTFTPTFAVHDFKTPTMPSTRADFDGDGIDDMIELDAYRSSLHIVKGVLGPAFQLWMLADPVVGNNGKVRVSLSVPSTLTETITLSTSDEAITVASTADIPSGTLSVDIPFNIGDTFDPSSVFAVYATLRGETRAAYGTKETRELGAGVQIFANFPDRRVFAGETTQDYGVGMLSLAGYSGVVGLECQGLPAGASCELKYNEVTLPAGSHVPLPLVVRTQGSTPGGSYVFDLVATLGSQTVRLPLSLGVGDFSLRFDNSTVGAVGSGIARFEVFADATNGYQGVINLTCTNIPPSSQCFVPPFTIAGDSFEVSIQTNNTPAGDYTFTVTGTNGLATRSATGTVKVVNVTATTTASSGTINLGGSFQTNVDISAPNGFPEPINLQCVAPTGTTCAFSQNPVNFAAGVTTQRVQVTITVTSLPSLVATSRSTSLASLLIAILPLAIACISMRRRRVGRQMLVLILLAFLVVGCGGGGGGSSAGPRPPSPTPTPPPPSSQNVTVTIRMNSGLMTKDLATITLTVNK